MGFIRFRAHRVLGLRFWVLVLRFSVEWDCTLGCESSNAIDYIYTTSQSHMNSILVVVARPSAVVQALIQLVTKSPKLKSSVDSILVMSISSSEPCFEWVSSTSI